MATANVSAPARTDWILSNPWLWSGLGFGSCLVAWVINFFLGDDVRIVFVFLGLLSIGAGLALRMQSSQPAFIPRLSPPRRAALMLGLASLFFLVAVALLVVLALAVAGVQGLPWYPGQLVLILILVAPVCVYAAILCWRRATDMASALTDREESALLLLVTAFALFVCCFALYTPSDPLDLDTLRLFLAVALFGALVAAPLMLLPETPRRVAISALILLHFGGICTASLAAAPSPWIIGQIWTRIYRPYLEFMYLNNAYHFYSPEPGPASHLWFRIFYIDDKNREFAEWYKIPEMNDDGRHQYPVSLLYQRMLSLTENTVPTGDVRPKFERDDKGKPRAAKYYYERLRHAPKFDEFEDNKNIVGKEPPPPPSIIVPFDSVLSQDQQYLPPSLTSRWLFESFVRHLARKQHHEHPEWQFQKAKVYRVVHIILPMPLSSTPPVFRDIDPQDPELYRPYYMGEYDKDGKALDDSDENGKKVDPFLYWMLPILRDEGLNANSVIRDYARLHAGDKRWSRQPTGDWVEYHRTHPLPFAPIPKQ